MAKNIKRVARARRWKRVAIIGAAVTTVTLGVFTVISFLPKGNDAFSIRISDPDAATHFHMTLNSAEREQSVTYVRAKSLDYMELTNAQRVEDHIAECAAKDQLSEENYLVELDEKGEVKKSFALVYTVYLVNDSLSDSQVVKYAVDVDGYKLPSNTAYSPVQYLRVLCQTEIVDSTEDTLENNYFGYHHTRYPELVNDKGDTREAISRVKRDYENDLLISKFASEGNDGYCEDFEDFENDVNAHLINNVKFEIPAGQMMRFTFVAYYEGYDPDAEGQVPQDSYILLSLHFGV